MKKILSLTITSLITALVIAAGYFIITYRLGYPSHAAVEEKDMLRVKHVNESLVLDVDADLWEDIEPEKISLYPQAARVPYGNIEKDLWVRSVYNDHEIAFLLEFPDDTENRNPPTDPDGCAILITPLDSPATVQMMGYAGKANVWHWLANRDTERYEKANETMNVVRELTASGPGTQTPMKAQNVDGKGKYRDGKWSVVFKRQLKSLQEDEFELKSGRDMQVAFALWDGVKAETFSRKSISILRTLELEK